MAIGASETTYQLFNDGNQCQKVLLDGQVEGILLLQVDRDWRQNRDGQYQ